MRSRGWGCGADQPASRGAAERLRAADRSATRQATIRPGVRRCAAPCFDPGSYPYDTAMDDRLYFRQLLSGRDIAKGDQMARQMVNFAYLVGDRETGEAVVVDPAYNVDDILAVLEADGMRLVGALGTHYHADHIGGSMMGFSVAGIADLLERVTVPIHIQRDEADYVRKTTGVGDQRSAVARQRRCGQRRRDRHRVDPHARAHAGQSMLLGGQSSGRRRHVVPRRLRAH